MHKVIKSFYFEQGDVSVTKSHLQLLYDFNCVPPNSNGYLTTEHWSDKNIRHEAVEAIHLYAHAWQIVGE